MTTETMPAPRDTGVAVLLGAAAATGLLGLAAVALGALTSGSPAALGATIGLVLVVCVFGFGSLVVNAVAAVMPTAALLVALLTYTLQVVAMAVVFVALSRSGLLDDAVDRRWLGGTVIAGTMAWLVGQLLLATRRRIPAYDLPAADSARPAPETPEAGDRG
jgi:ATP synthase protein I